LQPESIENTFKRELFVNLKGEDNLKVSFSEFSRYDNTLAIFSKKIMIQTPLIIYPIDKNFALF